MHTAAHTTQKQQHQEPKLQHKTQMQRPQQLQQKQNDTRKTTQKQQHQKLESDKETIQLSSDGEQTTVAAAAPATPATAATSSASSNIYALNSGSNAVYEQRNRSCARSRSRSHSGSSSSLSSTLSSSYRSLDYEAEADEEDANECEGVELQRKLAGGNDNLMHVQNFLNCFDTQERRRQKSSAICCATQPQQQEMLRQLDEKVQRMGKHLPVGETNLSRISSCVENEFATRDQVAVTIFPTTTAVAPVAIATAATMSTTTVTTNAIAAKSPSKPGKFTISTKFLRKPRHKLKSVNLAPTMGMSKTLAATTIDSEEMVALHERQKVLQQRGNEHVSQQQQHHRQPIPVDEPNVNVNVKFNSNFSINSLLNKR
ncbi:uncharacterized protein LOC128871629 [Anastrepha ludens]|uniref:uncharacterized protein LOC128871629 n=1 Tax=Anastrepha ludens TaxID=28586 RepID=UPI0023AFC81E|nr:uncharacterized protein LOC128871629 [Anastrepha ludens]